MYAAWVPLREESSHGDLWTRRPTDTGGLFAGHFASMMPWAAWPLLLWKAADWKGNEVYMTVKLPDADRYVSVQRCTWDAELHPKRDDVLTWHSQVCLQTAARKGLRVWPSAVRDASRAPWDSSPQERLAPAAAVARPSRSVLSGKSTLSCCSFTLPRSPHSAPLSLDMGFFPQQAILQWKRGSCNLTHFGGYSGEGFSPTRWPRQPQACFSGQAGNCPSSAHRPLSSYCHHPPDVLCEDSSWPAYQPWTLSPTLQRFGLDNIQQQKELFFPSFQGTNLSLVL